MFEYYKADIKRLTEHRKGFRNLLSEFFSLGFFAISVYRFFNWLTRNKIPNLIIRFPIEKLVEILCGISLPAKCKIGPGLRIHHFGEIVIHDSVKIGKSATIYHGVTVGVKKDDQIQGPMIGDNVYIGAGAKVLGNIQIGHNVIIGANAVTLSDVPDNATVAGIPAKIVTSNKRQGIK